MLFLDTSTNPPSRSCTTTKIMSDIYSLFGGPPSDTVGPSANGSAPQAQLGQPSPAPTTTTKSSAGKRKAEEAPTLPESPAKKARAVVQKLIGDDESNKIYYAFNLDPFEDL